MSQAPTRVLIFLGNVLFFVFFMLFLCFQMCQKNGRRLGGSRLANRSFALILFDLKQN